MGLPEDFQSSCLVAYMRLCGVSSLTTLLEQLSSVHSFDAGSLLHKNAVSWYLAWKFESIFPSYTSQVR